MRRLLNLRVWRRFDWAHRVLDSGMNTQHQAKIWSETLRALRTHFGATQVFCENKVGGGFCLLTDETEIAAKDCGDLVKVFCGTVFPFRAGVIHLVDADEAYLFLRVLLAKQDVLDVRRSGDSVVIFLKDLDCGNEWKTYQPFPAFPAQSSTRN